METLCDQKVDYLRLLSELKDARRVLRWNTYDPYAFNLTDRFNADNISTSMKREFYKKTFTNLIEHLDTMKSEAEQKLQFIFTWAVFIAWKYQVQGSYMEYHHMNAWTILESKMQRACREGTSPDLEQIPHYIGVLENILDVQKDKDKLSKLTMLKMSL